MSNVKNIILKYKNNFGILMEFLCSRSSCAKGKESLPKHDQIQKVLSEGVQKFAFFFLIDEGIEDPNVTINGPSMPASERPFQWHFAGGPIMAQH